MTTALDDTTELMPRSRYLSVEDDLHCPAI